LTLDEDVQHLPPDIAGRADHDHPIAHPHSPLRASPTYRKIGSEATQGPVVILVLDKDRMADYQKIAQTLRAAGIRAEIYLGEAGMKVQMKYADKRNSPCAVIQGGDEKAKGEVTIKDLILGANITSTKDRDEYLKKQAEAQFAVKESELVEAVKRVLARHKS